MPALALYQPDIPQNVGAMLRLCACFGAPCHIIEPCGFAFDEKRLKRVAMDYMEHAAVMRHISWEKFLETKSSRLILLSTKAATPYTQFSFRPDDILLMGRESAGVPDDVRDACDARLLIPMAPQARSLNVGMAAAIVLAEMKRQLSA